MTMTRIVPTNSDDVIDSHNVINAIEHDLLPQCTVCWGIIERVEDTWSHEDVQGEFSDRDHAPDPDSDAENLLLLTALSEEGESATSDWRAGVTLVRDSYFEEYARTYADDIGAVNSDISWPYTYIDWERAAADLRMDYTSVDFDGVTYWVR